jgi:dienelactone hydrolase
MSDGPGLPDLVARLRDGLTFPWNFNPAVGSFADWQAETRHKICQALDIDIANVPPPPARVLGDWRDGTLLGQHLQLSFSNGETADAYVLRLQHTAPGPAVLLLHDHGSCFAIGRQKLIRRPDEESTAARCTDAWVQRVYDGRHIGNDLARRGYVVLAVDALGWGGRQVGAYEDQQALAANLLQVGTSLASVVLREDLEALAFLKGLPGVDPTRVAALGFSMGGSRAWQLSALSSDVSACVSGGWMGTLKGLMQPGNNQLRGQSAFYMLHPALSGKIDFPHLAGLAAPKPGLFFSGRQDRHFPESIVADAFHQMQRLWTAAGAGDALQTRFSQAGHVFTAAQQDDAIDFLDRVV